MRMPRTVHNEDQGGSLFGWPRSRAGPSVRLPRPVQHTRPDQGDVLRDEAADGESENISLAELQRGEEDKGTAGHPSRGESEWIPRQQGSHGAPGVPPI